MLAAFLWFVGSHNAALLVGVVTLFMMALAVARWRDI
jgi:cellobiose-specific phosphotransferase system component IIC